MDLRESGLVQPAMLDSLEKRMSKLDTRIGASHAIGAAKELVEACNRSACDLLELEWRNDDNLGKVGRRLKDELATRAASGREATSALTAIFSGLSQVEHGLSDLRNEMGTGHGKPRLSPDLQVRHGHLGVDVAEAHVRYLVLSLRDLDLL